MESACKEMGLSLSMAFNIFAVKVGNERRIPFKVAADPFYSESKWNTFEGIGKPEPLKNNKGGWWSRRIDESNRIVYKEKDGSIIIASCKGHYNDK